MTVEITPEEVAEAEELQRQIYSRLSKNPNYTGIQAKDRFKHGFLGEFGARRIFKQAGIRFKFEIKTDGKSNPNSEFTVYKNGEPFSLEVKTAAEPSHQYFMFPKAQDWQKSDLYVGMQLMSPSSAVCWGSILAAEVAKLPVKVFPPYNTPTRYKLLNDLQPIGLILAFADREP